MALPVPLSAGISAKENEDKNKEVEPAYKDYTQLITEIKSYGCDWEISL